MIFALVPAQVAVDGVVNGAVYALIGMGVVLVHRSTRVVNLAAGAMGLPGAGLLALLHLQYGVPYWLALVAGLGAGALLALVLELVVVRRLFTAPRVVVLVATIGVAQLCQAIVVAYPDIDEVRARFPVPIGNPMEMGGIWLSPADQLSLLTVPVAAVLLAWVLTRTHFGRTVTASADNPRLARLSGVSPRRASTVVWVMSGLLSTATLILIASDVGNVTQIVTLGPATMARALAVAVLAGLVSFPRALLAGLALGLVEAVVAFNSIGLPGLPDAVVFVAVLVAVGLQTQRDPAGGATSFGFLPRSRPVPVVLRDRWWVRHAQLVGGGAALAAAAALPLVITSPSRVYLFTTILCVGLVALSVSVITGWAGQLSLGQMALAGLSALVAAMYVRGQVVSVALPLLGEVAVRLGPIGIVPALLVATAVTIAVSSFLGIGALRVRGLLLAVSTFAFAQFCERFLFRTGLFTGGRRPPVRFPRGTLFGVDLANQRTYYWCVLAVVAVAVVIVARLRRRGPGRRMVAVRDNADVAAAYTVHPTRTKLSAFALAGALAGVGGALLGGLSRNININEVFVVGDSLDVVAIAVIGGLGSLTGPFLGAIWVKGLPALFPGNDVLPLLSSSIGLLVLLLYLPTGLVQIGHSIRDTALAAWAARIESQQGRRPEKPEGPGVEAPATAVPRARREPTRLDRRTSDASDTGGEPLLRAEGLNVRFGGLVAVRDVSLHVNRGEVLGLIGTNGAGKSTVLNAICGYVQSAGRVHLGEEELTGLPPEQRASRGLGRTFQAAQLFPSLTVHETIMVALEARRRTGLLATAVATPGAIRAERRTSTEADEILSFLGLGRFADATIGTLSTGTRRIVELAGLLALDARVLCLDEPTAGVAQREAEAFGPLIRGIRDELGAGVVVIEHDMPLIMSISDRIQCLEAGRIIAGGPPEIVRNDPAVVASYLGADPRAIERSDSATRPAPEPSRIGTRTPGGT